MRMHNFISARTELLNRCNRRCGFCPSSTEKYLSQPRKEMSQQTFELAVRRFADVGYDGSWGTCDTGEPLLVKNLEEYYRYFHAHVPRAKMLLNTNGVLLNADRLISLLDTGIAHLLINVYDEEEVPRIAAMLESVKPELDRRGVVRPDKRPNVADQPRGAVVVDMRHRPFGKRLMGVNWQNRGGNIDYYARYGIEHKRKTLPRQAGCTMPFRYLLVNGYGDIKLCCSDWYTDINTGSVSDGDLMPVFNGPARLAYMRLLLNRDRDIPLCCRCDYGGGGYQGSLRLPRAAETVWGHATDEELKGYLWQQYGHRFTDELSQRLQGTYTKVGVPRPCGRFPR